MRVLHQGTRVGGVGFLFQAFAHFCYQRRSLQLVRVEKSLQCAGKPGACGHTVSYPSQKTVGGRGKYSFFSSPGKKYPWVCVGRRCYIKRQSCSREKKSSSKKRKRGLHETNCGKFTDSKQSNTLKRKLCGKAIVCFVCSVGSECGV